MWFLAVFYSLSLALSFFVYFLVAFFFFVIVTFHILLCTYSKSETLWVAILVCIIPCCWLSIRVCLFISCSNFPIITRSITRSFLIETNSIHWRSFSIRLQKLFVIFRFLRNRDGRRRSSTNSVSISLSERRCQWAVSQEHGGNGNSSRRCATGSFLFFISDLRQIDLYSRPYWSWTIEVWKMLWLLSSAKHLPSRAHLSSRPVELV